jgi:hypothetical protein
MKADMIEIVDPLQLSDAMKDEIVLPYLSGLFKSLSAGTEAPDKGIPRVHLLNVPLSCSLIPF